MEKYEEKLSKIIHSTYLEPCEIGGRLQVASSLIYINGYHGYIYGAGKDVDMFIQYFEKDGIQFHGIIDRDKKKWGTFIRDVKVISPEEFTAKGDKRAYVFIYTLCSHNSVNEREILNFLFKSSVIDYSFVGNDRYSVSAYLPSDAQFEEGRREYYQRNEKAIKGVLNEFGDAESKEILLEFIRSFMESSVYRLEQLPTIWKYFYGANGRDLYKHIKGEVWINFGASVGDTIFLYFRNRLQAKKIYAIEGDSQMAAELKYNLKLLPDVLRNKIEVIEHFVKNDNYFAGRDKFDEKISLINCDIEGAELEMLHQMRNVISRDRPVLAISLYHKKEDIIEIPQFIKSIVDNYTIKLRKYAPYNQNNIRRSNELVLYAIPDERRNISDNSRVNDGR